MPEVRYTIRTKTVSEEWEHFWEDGPWKEYSAEHFNNSPIQPYILEAFHRRKARKVIDIGCGWGRWLRFMEEIGYASYGIDYDEAILDIGRREAPTLKIAAASSHALCFPNQTFDVYLSVGALEHLEDGLAPSLNEAFRVLKPGGLLIVTVPLWNLVRRLTYPVRQVIQWIRQLSGWYQGELVFQEYRFSRAELMNAVQSKGFLIQEIISADFHEPGNSIGLYIDYSFLRGESNFSLNSLGRLVKLFSDTISPWLISGMVAIIALKPEV